MRYEAFLNSNQAGEKDWQRIFAAIFKLCRQGEKATLTVAVEQNVVRYFFDAPRKLPYMLPGVDALVFAETSERFTEIASLGRLAVSVGDSLAEVISKLSGRDQELKYIRLSGRKLARGGTFSAEIVATSGGKAIKKLLPLCSLNLLTVDFSKSSHLLKRELPKFLDIEKSLPLLQSDSTDAILRAETYPFFSGEYYLGLSKFDFDKHTMLVGASGSGKTKFLGSFVSALARNDAYRQKYRVVVIDPHDALRDDIGGLPGVQTYDYLTRERSLDLFASSEREVVVHTDMTLTLIKSILGGQYNAKLERLARACVHLLTIQGNGNFNFASLRRLLTEIEYKNSLVAEVGDYLPASLQDFFGQDYNQLRTQDYDRAFAPLISFIDELQLLPAFYRPAEDNLPYAITKNFGTIISLNQAKLGEKCQKVIAGLILNQLFVLMQRRVIDEHIILVIDEVAVVENPVLVRFLSEARKFNVSVVLAGQYFGQISPALRTSIFANVANYFCFRVAREDAELLAAHLDMEVSTGFERDKVDLLSRLPARRCVARLSHHGILATGLLGSSLDFTPVPDVRLGAAPAAVAQSANAPAEKLNFAKATASILDIMKEQSTGRRKING